MRNVVMQKYFLLCLRILLALVFLFAAIGKISNPEEFAVAITNYKMFPTFIINLIAIIVPWIELVIGLLMLFGIAVKENAIIISTFLFCFIIIIAIALIRGLDIQCGCFSTHEGQRIGITKILENFIMLAFGIYLVLFYEDNIFSKTSL
ncbi:MAG: hypothetical protein A2V66_03380 [Ignavibacteria bacterium RBG_13_36_8]|nr:MAG: hypothetical protein A2V66_03380 [Ignavibacteria bacterium RBG_13_36_8]